MKKEASDRFLGAWDVSEFIYGAKGEFCGRVEQSRSLYEEKKKNHLRVSQTCRPSPALLGHPMESFAGTFEFSLIRQGRRRLYQGPDVEGSAWNWGEIFLRGEGVWPRFGYNFQSWSLALSDQKQMTGGIFYRGSAVAAVVVGFGTAAAAPHTDEGNELTMGTAIAGAIVPPSIDLASGSDINAGRGTWHRLDILGEREAHGIVTRRMAGPGRWVEHGVNGSDLEVTLEPREQDFLMTRVDPKGVRRRGFAKAYGPILYWDVYGVDGSATTGMEIRDMESQRLFSIRRNFLHGQLLSLEGLQLGEHL